MTHRWSGTLGLSLKMITNDEELNQSKGQVMCVLFETFLQHHIVKCVQLSLTAPCCCCSVS